VCFLIEKNKVSIIFIIFAYINKNLNMKTKTCNKALHKLSPLTDKEINGVKMGDGSIDKTTIIGRKGDSVCTKCGKVFRKA